jgi:hypothetical protein
MGISIWQLLIILAIVVQSFRSAVKDGEGAKEDAQAETKAIDEGGEGQTIDGEVTSKEKDQV